MRDYRWKGINLKGQPVSGKLRAKNKLEARASLRRQKIASTRVAQIWSWPQSPNRHNIKHNQITLFFTQMATLLESGVPLIHALGIIKRTFNGQAFEQVIAQISNLVSSGHSLSFALSQHPSCFDQLICTLTKTGEATGHLDKLMRQIATYRSRKEALVSKTKKALYYPISVIVFALMITVGLLLFVIPQFEQLFTSFGAQLPALTKGVIQISNVIQQHGGWASCLLLVSLFVGWRVVSGSEKLRAHWDSLILSLPLFGKLIQQAVVTRFCQTLSITLQSDLPIHHAIRHASSATHNRYYQQQLSYTQMEVEAGTSLSKALEATGDFPPMALNLIAIGEESGSLDDMLDKLHHIFSQELDQQIEGLLSLLEPTIIVFLGCIIGGLVMAMYLPIFEIVKVV